MTTLQSIFFSKTHSPKIHVNRNTTFREKKTHAALANFSINAQFDEWMSDGRDTNWSHAHIAIPSRVEIPILKPAPIIPSSIFGFLFHFLAFYTLHLSLRRFSSLAPLYHPVFHHLSTSVKLFFSLSKWTSNFFTNKESTIKSITTIRSRNRIKFIVGVNFRLESFLFFPFYSRCENA